MPLIQLKKYGLYRIDKNEVSKMEKNKTEKVKTDKAITFRLSDEHLEMIKSLANDYGFSMTEFILYACRMVGTNEAILKRQTKIEEELELLNKKNEALDKQLKSINSKLNKIDENTKHTKIF